MTTTFVTSTAKPAARSTALFASTFVCQPLQCQNSEKRQLDSSSQTVLPNRRISIKCNAESARVPDSPTALFQSWRNSRSIASTLDLSRRFVSVLFLSNRCERACLAEKTLMKVAEKYAISRRLLILSAGIDSQPGDLLPLRLVSNARERDIDLSDERPCAAFEATDLDYYDFVVVVDRNVRDRLMRMAEVSAHTTGGHLYEWERKIRLLCDFDESISNNATSTSRCGVQPLDVPPFESTFTFGQSMDVISNACEHLVCTLLAAGL